MIKNRSIALVIILSLVTCGIYGWYWIYQSLNEMEQETGKTDGMNSTVVLILAILFPPVGYLLYGISANDQLNAVRAMRGVPEVDNKVLYMVLGFVIPIVLVVLVQNEINKYATAA